MKTFARHLTAPTLCVLTACCAGPNVWRPAHAAPDAARPRAADVEVKTDARATNGMVFSGVAGTTSEPATFTIINHATQARAVTALAIQGENAAFFHIQTPPALPLTVEAGQSVALGIAFTPGVGKIGIFRALLTLSAGADAVEMPLCGLATKGKAGGNEPPLSQVLAALGCKINVGGDKLVLTIDDKLIGDEIAAPLFRKAGAGAVSIVPLARYSPDEPLPFGYYVVPDGAPQRSVVATLRAGQDQTLLPKVEDGGKDTFEPGEMTFGLFTHSRTDQRITHTQAQWNTGIKHAVRVYPDKDVEGNTKPNRYIVTFEEATNGDYQDYVFGLSNVQPVP